MLVHHIVMIEYWEPLCMEGLSACPLRLMYVAPLRAAVPDHVLSGLHPFLAPQRVLILSVALVIG